MSIKTHLDGNHFRPPTLVDKLYCKVCTYSQDYYYSGRINAFVATAVLFLVCFVMFSRKKTSDAYSSDGGAEAGGGAVSPSPPEIAACFMFNWTASRLLVWFARGDSLLISNTLLILKPQRGSEDMATPEKWRPVRKKRDIPRLEDEIPRIKRKRDTPM